MLRAMRNTDASIPAIVVIRRLRWMPSTSARAVSATSGTSANGMPNDSTT